MDKILTIVIPTYNMEKYLRHNLGSLIVPEKEQQMLEVLIVNDGSKDSSSAIGHEYQDKYPDVFRVIDKPNGNYGSCVNRGLKEAKGKYIKVLDADDSFDNASLVKYLNQLQSCDADLVITDYDLVTPEGGLIQHKTYSFESNKVMPIDSICATQEFKAIAMHALTYKTALIRQIDYKQTEGISYTDQEWIFLPMTTMKTVEYMPYILYLYMIGREGQTMDPKVIAKNLGHYYQIINNRLDEMAKRHLKLSDAMKEYTEHKTILLATFIYRAVILRRISDLQQLIALDDHIKAVDSHIYNRLDQEKMKGIPFRFIHYFRLHHKYAPFFISWIYNKVYENVKIKNQMKNRNSYKSNKNGGAALPRAKN